MSQIYKPGAGGGGGSNITLVDDSGNTLVGTNFPILGEPFNSAKVMQTQVSGLNFLIANNTWDTAYVVDQNTTYGKKGTFSTIQAAVNAIVADGVATSSLAGLIKIRPGVYNEATITIPAGVIIVLFGDIPAAVANATFTNGVRINGTIVLTDPTTLYIYNLMAIAIDPVPGSSSLFALNSFINTLNLLGTANLDNCWGAAITADQFATLNCSFCENLSINLINAFVTIENSNNVAVNQNTSFSQVFVNESSDLTLIGATDPSSVAFVQNALINNAINLTGGTLYCGSLIEGQGGFSNFLATGVVSKQLRMTKGNCYISKIINADSNIDAYDYFVGVKGNVAAVAITLSVSPLAVARTQTWRISDLEGTAATNPITITPSAGLINGAASYVINTNYGSIEIYTDGTNFFVLGNNLPLPVSVANGGTGRSTLTNHGILVGATTSPITQLAAGTADTVLRSGGASADPSYSTTFKISSADVMTNTSQPCFLAYNANTASNVTGDGTVYTCQFDTVSFDNAGNFASNTFTAPRTGRYEFNAGMYAADLGVGHTLANLQLVTSGGILLYLLYCNPVAISNGSNLLITGSAIVPMTAGDTCNVRLVVSGSTKTIDWVGAALNANPPFFSGQLMC